MSIAANDRIKRTNISAADTGPHSCDFPLLDKNEVVVKVVESDGTVNSYTVDVDYTVGSVPGDTPTVTFLDGDDVPAGVLVLQGNEDLDQTYTGADTNATREAYRDKTAKVQQQINEKVSRAIKFALHSTLTDKDFPDFSSADSGKIIGINASGELALIDAADADIVSLTAVGTAIGTAATYAAVRALLDLEPGTDIYSKSALDTLLAAKLALAGGTMTGVLDMDGNAITMGGAVINMESAKITNVTDPTSAQDAATKAYADALLAPPEQYVLIKDDFIGVVYDETANWVMSEIAWTLTNSGTSAGVSTPNTVTGITEPGVIRLNTGTDTTGRSGIICGSDVRVSGGTIEFKKKVRLSTIADATDDYDAMVGMVKNGDLRAVSDGFYFLYDRDTNVNWLICAENVGTATQTDSGVAVGTSWVMLGITVAADGLTAEFFIDDVSVGTVSTNVPTSSDDLYPMCAIDKEAGTTSRTMDVDFFKMLLSLTASR